MKVSLEMLERGTLLRSMNSRQLMFYNWGWSLNYMDAMNFLGELWYGPSPYNKSWQSPAFDALIGKARGVYDDSARFALYAEAQALMMRDWGACPLPTELRSALIKPDLQGVTYTPRGLMNFKNASLVD